MVSGVGAGLQFLNFAAVGHYTETPVPFGRLQSSLRSTHPTLEKETRCCGWLAEPTASLTTFLAHTEFNHFLFDAREFAWIFLCQLSLLNPESYY